MLHAGGVVQIEIEWHCNFDFWNYWHDCFPAYKFSRFDMPFSKSYAASGFNFRFSDKYLANGTMQRVLIKAYGILFYITASGQAGRFDVVPLFVSIGSGLGLLSVATLIADLVLLNCSTKRKLYFNYKELDANQIRAPSAPTGSSLTEIINENC
jgi:P2X purinoceptor 4